MWDIEQFPPSEAVETKLVQKKCASAGGLLQAIEETARLTLSQVDAIKTSFEDYKQRIRKDFPKLYSQDLINSLFNHPYTKIEFLERDLGVSRLTATKYLDLLSETFLTKQKVGRNNYYVNNALFDILINEA